jgi:phospholipid/cholesterol/gamma-HCH transport system permease protein
MSTAPGQLDKNKRRNPIEAFGALIRSGLGRLVGGVVYVGGIVRLFQSIAHRLVLSTRGGIYRVRAAALVQQAVRVGVKSIPIIVLVQVFIGIILSLSLARPLDDFGQLDRVATVVALAMFREMGALISAVVLSGFAGASIAAELGAMVEGEEIKAMRAHALDPIRFLVVPRVIATTVMMVGLTVIANIVGVLGGFATSTLILDVNPTTYLNMTRDALTLTDYLTGLLKGGVFGAIIASLACFEGLNVRGGAQGVGQATTTTVVKSIVCLIGADCIFAVIFYTLELW